MTIIGSGRGCCGVLVVVDAAVVMVVAVVVDVAFMVVGVMR